VHLSLRTSSRWATLCRGFGLIVALWALPSAALAADANTSLQSATAADPAHAYMQIYGVDEAEANRRLELQRRAADLVPAMTADLGERFGGLYFDNGTGRFRVLVASASGLEATRADAAGVAARPELKRAAATLTAVRLDADTTFVPVTHRWRDLLTAQDEVLDAIAPEFAQHTVRVDTDVAANGLTISVADTASKDDRAAADAAASASSVSARVVTVPASRLEAEPIACSYPNCDRPLRGAQKITSSPGTSRESPTRSETSSRPTTDRPETSASSR
jgi:hypothetical protein